MSECGQPLWEIPKDQIDKADGALRSIRMLREHIAPPLLKPAEFFEPHQKLDLDSRKDPIRKIKYLSQTALMRSQLFKRESNLKLLSGLDGYLFAIDQKLPIVAFLCGRYVLECVATVNYIAEKLTSIANGATSDWLSRGVSFLTTLNRARYSASDPFIASKLRDRAGLSKSALDPINITEAIEALSRTSFFPSAKIDYNFLSNYCHNNGTASMLFHHSTRQAEWLSTPDGSIVMTDKPFTAVTLQYQPQLGFQLSLVHTATMVLSSATWCQEILKEMPLGPYKDQEVRIITKGELATAVQRIRPGDSIKNTSLTRPGRNAPCPCGSGKKFKFCCMQSSP